MTVDRIIPCVCTPHPPTLGDSVRYGMPVLTPYCTQPHKQYWTIKCPVCGRGGAGMEETSAYKALKKWNQLMRRCYKLEGKEIAYTGNFEEFFDPMTGKKYEKFRSGWDEI